MRDLTLVAVLVLFAGGLAGVVFSQDRRKRVMALFFLQSSAVFLFVSLGYRQGGRPPLFTLMAEGGPMALPSAQAMATSFLILSSVTVALLLALAFFLPRREGTIRGERKGRSR